MKATGTTDGADANGIASGEEPESRAAGETELERGEGVVGEVDTPEEVTPGITDEQQAETTAITELSPLRWLQVTTGALFIILSVLTITFRKRSV